MVQLTPFQDVAGESISGSTVLGARGILLVESPVLPAKAMLPIIHKVDFQNAGTLFKERGLRDTEEALVSYYPANRGLFKLISGTLPKLQYRVHYKGATDFYYKNRIDGTSVEEIKHYSTVLAQYGSETGQ